jgi:hypothetical protein
MMRSDLPHAPHKEVLVKVNAYVDEGIAPLVEALNKIDGVITLESCQGDSENEAEVDFYYGQFARTSPSMLAVFADRVARALNKGGSYRSRIALEWLDGNVPHILLTLPTEDIGLVASAVGFLVESDDSSECILPIDSSHKVLPKHFGEPDE